ncbi:MAG TPA: hypothetical protein VFI65_02500 [Streptosporangiaceae bacterium]|nr:hypothetical protein [Streptosporangiaceae bacterium]
MALAGGRQAGWRPVATIGPPNGVTYVGDFVATSANDAWSTWGDCAPCGSRFKQANWLEHWTGRAWRRVSMPRRVGRLLSSVDGIGATSASDLWLISSGKAAHWNGKHWGIMKIPSWVVRINLSGDAFLSVCDFGPSDLWVFSNGVDSFKPVVPFAARYNGHHWAKVRLAGVPDGAVGLGPSDIWADAEPADLKGAPFLMHWNGKSWAKVAEPKPSGVPAHFKAIVEGLVALGPDDVWLQQNIVKSGGLQRTDFLLHWNGRSWARVRYGFSPDGVQMMTGDGRGGLWISDYRANKAQTRYLVHYSAGRWHRQLVPAPKGTTVQQVLTINLIPGTRSAWATGGVLPVNSTESVLGEIWKFGP